MSMRSGEGLSRRSFLQWSALTAGFGLLATGTTTSAWAAPGRVPQPAQWLVTRWKDDPWARGAYAALPAGVAPKVRWTIAENLIRRRVAVAGEFTDWGYSGTVQGALRSGRLAAKLLDEDGVGVNGRRAFVIGAGVSGLEAATQLADRGAEVTVLEARDRVGGRIRTDTSWGTPVELGATWIHGVTGNPMVPVTRAAGLSLSAADYFFDTRSVDTGTYAPGADQVRSDLGEYLQAMEDADPARRLSVEQWLDQNGWSASDPERAWALNTLITQEYSIDPDVLGTHAYLEGKDDRGGDAFVLGGFQRAPEHLAASLDVRLNSPVASVSAGKRGVMVLETDGTSHRADIAVVALPHPVLKSGVVRVSGLPKASRRGITQLRTGNLERIVLRFDEPWWTASGITAPGIGLVGARWSEWYDVSANTGIPTLVGFCGGRAADGMPASDTGVVAEAVSELTRAFAK